MNKACFFSFLCSISLMQSGPSPQAIFLKSLESHKLTSQFLMKWTVGGCVVGCSPAFLLYKDSHFSKQTKLVRYSTYVGLPLLGALGGFTFGRYEQNQALKRLRRLGL